MIQIQDKTLCCGCNACGDVCAKGAISFKTDSEGFWYPEIDKDKCVVCGLCETVCPVINVETLKKNDLPQSICYAAEHKNLEVVFDSTSGGLFTALADAMYKQGGYVGGAVFDEGCKSVSHFISNDRSDLERLRSSKYLQSDASGFYAKVRSLLKQGQKVLVCGTPCQMAALRAFLGKEYENLIIVDFICRGINSPKVWGKYIDSFEERYGSKVVWAKAKSKEYGWRNLTQKVILEDGRHLYETKEVSAFTRGYLFTNAYCRPSCYDCRFKGYPRMADITLADFWGVEKVEKLMDKNLGTSLVMINSHKGEEYFSGIQSRIRYVSVPFKTIEAGNMALIRPLSAPKVGRDAFFNDVNSMSFVGVADKYIKSDIKPSIKRRIKSLLVYYWSIIRITRGNPKALCQFIRFNSWKEIKSGDILLPTPHCIIDIKKGAKVIKSGRTVIGEKSRFPKSRLETRLLVDNGGALELGRGIEIGYGSDIEVFSGATLSLGSGFASNCCTTVVCASSIVFDEDVKVGRNVTVRDNNGGHYINRQGYKDINPVHVGKKVWLCEQSTIMSGVKIGDGAIVGAKSFVIRNVPDHCMVSGHPAEVIDENVLWKY